MPPRLERARRVGLTLVLALAAAPPVAGTILSVQPRSVVVLFAAAAPVPPEGAAPPA